MLGSVSTNSNRATTINPPRHDDTSFNDVHHEEYADLDSDHIALANFLSRPNITHTNYTISSNHHIRHHASDASSGYHQRLFTTNSNSSDSYESTTSSITPESTSNTLSRDHTNNTTTFSRPTPLHNHSSSTNYIFAATTDYVSSFC